MEEQNQKVGWIGLWLAIGGMVLPILMVILDGMGFGDATAFLCALLFLASEVAALGCGIASRKSGPGRAALIVSAVSLVLSVLMFLWFSTFTMVEKVAVETAAAKATMDNAASEKLAAEKTPDKPSMEKAVAERTAAVKKQRTPAQLALGDPVVNSVDMLLVPIPAGTFMMGSPETEKDRADDEHQHKVTISKAFYMQTTEVTQGQWKAIMGTDPWKGEDYVKEGANYPAMFLSWDDAVAYCKKLSAKEGKTYRLPTEAEWEYACRAGTQTTWSFGNNEASLDNYAWYFNNAWDAGEQYAHQVGLKNPNAFGLYGMHGNMYEWCHDYYGEDYYKQSLEQDPTGPASGSFRVLRGGCWGHAPSCSRSALRNTTRDAANRGVNIGFRVVRELD